jgi:DNA-binding PadR family transcriptional regulator
MLPFNYALLHCFASGGETDAREVMRALESRYGGRRTFRKKYVDEALMAACVNGLLDETRAEFESGGELRIYYRASEEGLHIIDKYIKGLSLPKRHCERSEAIHFS